MDQEVALRFVATAQGVDEAALRTNQAVGAVVAQSSTLGAAFEAMATKAAAAFAVVKDGAIAAGEGIDIAATKVGLLKTGVAGVGETAGHAKQLILGFAAAFGFIKLEEMTKQSFEYAGSLNEVSRSIGVSTDQYQILRRAAIDYNISQDSMTRSISFLDKTLGLARANVPAAVQLFKALKIDPKNFSEAGDLLPVFMDRISNLKTRSEQAAATFRGMGRGATDMIPFIVQGGQAFDEAGEKARRMGMLTKEEADKAHEAEVQLKELALTLQTKLAIALADNAGKIVGFVNALVGLVTWANNAANALGGLGNKLGIVLAGLAALKRDPVMMGIGYVAGRFIGDNLQQSSDDQNTDLRFRSKKLDQATSIYHDRLQAERTADQNNDVTVGGGGILGTLIRFRHDSGSVPTDSGDGSIFRIRHAGDPAVAQGGSSAAALLEVKRQQKLYNAASAAANLPQTDSGPPQTGDAGLNLKPPGKGKQDPSVVAEWEAQLHQQEIASGEFFKDQTASELAFWTEKAGQVKKGSKDWLDIQGKIYELSKKQAHDAYEEQIGDLDLQIQAQRGNFAAQEALEQKKVDLVKTTFGEQSREYKAALREQERMVQEHEAQVARDTQEAMRAQLALRVDSLRTQLQLTQDYFTMMTEAVSSAEGMQTMTHRQAIAARRELLQQEYLNRRAELVAERDATLANAEEQANIAHIEPETKRQILREMEKDRADFNNRLRILDSQFNLDVMRNGQEAANQYYQTWVSRLSPVTNALTGMVNGILGSTQTLKQALLAAGSQILQAVNSWVMQQVQQVVIAEQMKTGAVQGGTVARLAAETAANATGMALNASSATAEITTHGAVAAAGALRAISHIPVIGPFIAPAIAAGIFALAMSFISKIASAEGGWERVPSDGMMTELHKDEMVLPSSIASPLRGLLAMGVQWSLGTTGAVGRNAAQSGAQTTAAAPAPAGGERPFNLHIHAMDGRSVKRLFLDHRGALVDALKSAARDANV